MHCRFISEIPQNEFSIIEQIGTGTFSDIFSAIHKKTNTKVTLKVSQKTNVKECDDILDQEVKINKSLHHPFICKFFTKFETDHLNIIVMELIEGTTMLDYVNQTHGLPLHEVRDIFTQFLIAIEYLHDEAHITHRDLKLENIMIDNYGHIRLIDFGFSSQNSMMSTLCGSIPYCAPEVFLGQMYTKESDIWSMGIILYALFNGNLPFFHTNTNNLISMICESEVNFPKKFDYELKDLLIRMLNKDPSQRIKIDEIKQHSFISKEKLININYKDLFSPTQINQDYNENSFLSENKDIPLKNNNLKYPTDYILNLTKEQKILHEKITLKTDDIDISIENRKNFAHDLTRLIESALVSDLYFADCSYIDNSQLFGSHASNNELDYTNRQLIQLSSHLAGSTDHINNHHFVLTNHFAGLKKSNTNNCLSMLKGNPNSNKSHSKTHPTSNNLPNNTSNNSSLNSPQPNLNSPQSNSSSPQSNSSSPQSNSSSPQSNLNSPQSNLNSPQSNLSSPQSNLGSPQPNSNSPSSNTNLSKIKLHSLQPLYIANSNKKTTQKPNLASDGQASTSNFQTSRTPPLSNLNSSQVNSSLSNSQTARTTFGLSANCLSDSNFQRKRQIRKNHLRNSSKPPLFFKAPIASPVIAHSTSNFCDE